MDLPPGPSNEPGDLNSDDDNVSNAIDDQHYDSNTDSEYDPDYEACPIVWAASTGGMREFPFTTTEQLLVPSPGTRPIDFFLLLVDFFFWKQLFAELMHTHWNFFVDQIQLLNHTFVSGKI